MKQCIAVVGAGFSGTVCAIHLLRHLNAPNARVILIDRQPRFARGLAYGVWDDNLILNVPAGNMTALDGQPDHFLAYCRNIDPHFNSGSFLPRRLYGDYLEDTLRDAERSAPGVLERVTADVEAIRKNSTDSGFLIQLADGAVIAAGRVVLALGHFAPATPQALSSLEGSPGYVADPWNLARLDETGRSGPVALVGAGHTAIDTLFRLTSRGDAGKIYLLSRRGLLPQSHRLTPKAPAVVGFPAYLEGIGPGTNPSGLRALLHATRREMRKRTGAGGDWRDVINELRPHTPRIWQQASAADRKRFLRWVRPFWDIHRHRLAPTARLRLDRLLESGQAELVTGHILRCRNEKGQVDLWIRTPGHAAPRQLTVNTVVNCTGPNYDVLASAAPLVRQLQDDGLVRADPLRLGLDINEGYQLIGRDGLASAGLYYVGPMLRASLWEGTAVPELRAHSARLAEILAQRDSAAGVSD